MNYWKKLSRPIYETTIGINTDERRNLMNNFTKNQKIIKRLKEIYWDCEHEECIQDCRKCEENLRSLYKIDIYQKAIFSEATTILGMLGLLNEHEDYVWLKGGNLEIVKIATDRNSKIKEKIILYIAHHESKVAVYNWLTNSKFPSLKTIRKWIANPETVPSKWNILISDINNNLH